MFKIVTLASVIGGLAFALTGLGAKANYITNGSFETTSGTGQLGYNTTATGWSTNGYNFIFGPGTADTTGSNGQYGSVTLWGSNNGGLNTLPASSPDGGNYVAADGAYNVGAITQTLTGLTAGEKYSVGFWYAGAQQHGYDGTTTEQWIVQLGSGPAPDDACPHRRQPRLSQAGITPRSPFTADGSTDVLSFLAAGTPNGEPPFSAAGRRDRA